MACEKEVEYDGETLLSECDAFNGNGRIAVAFSRLDPTDPTIPDDEVCVDGEYIYYYYCVNFLFTLYFRSVVLYIILAVAQCVMEKVEIALRNTTSKMWRKVQYLFSNLF
jgi:hypothetical protein